MAIMINDPSDDGRMEFRLDPIFHPFLSHNVLKTQSVKSGNWEKSNFLPPFLSQNG